MYLRIWCKTEVLYLGVLTLAHLMVKSYYPLCCEINLQSVIAHLLNIFSHFQLTAVSKRLVKRHCLDSHFLTNLIVLCEYYYSAV